MGTAGVEAVKPLWLVMIVREWDGAAVTLPQGTVPVTVTSTGAGVGFCPVYDDPEKARREWPGALIVEVKRV